MILPLFVRENIWWWWEWTTRNSDDYDAHHQTSHYVLARHLASNGVWLCQLCHPFVRLIPPLLLCLSALQGQISLPASFQGSFRLKAAIFQLRSGCISESGGWCTESFPQCRSYKRHFAETHKPRTHALGAIHHGAALQKPSDSSTPANSWAQP